MSATVVTDDAPAEGAEDQNQKVLKGNTKPLHRFLRGQPKCVGVAMVTLGISIFFLGVPVWRATKYSGDSFHSFVLGVLFIASGILFILTELNITKQLVTAGFGLSIVSICGVGVGCCIWMDQIINFLMEDYGDTDDNVTDHIAIKQYWDQFTAVQCLAMLQSLLGGAILIAMAWFARAALRSSNTNAIVVMQTRPPAE
ncbi:uncharacterized protein si:ch1073-291c23.2 [Sardina pilchardus]|uniref:uncharacterized protein si:ch1073-291c23.2 n=1 Tax=Sardina pilchardus TaxID=27697 RepID=UPI002E1274B2